MVTPAALGAVRCPLKLAELRQEIITVDMMFCV
jgi:hypothetical protein